MLINFDPRFPEALRASVEALLRRHTWILGGRIDELKLVFDEGGCEEGLQAAAIILEEYHIAVMTLEALFFTESAEEQELIIVHELVHFVTNPVNQEFSDLLEEFVPPEVRSYVERKIEVALEELTDRVARYSLRYAAERDRGDVCCGACEACGVLAAEVSPRRARRSEGALPRKPKNRKPSARGT